MIPRDLGRDPGTPGVREMHTGFWSRVDPFNLLCSLEVPSCIGKTMGRTPPSPKP